MAKRRSGFTALSTALKAELLEEGLRLEFKAPSDPGRAFPSSTDVKHLNRAISGFANAEGGTLIFGIKTKGGGGKPPKAISFSHISRAEQSASLLESKINVSPRFDGIKVEAIPDGKDGLVKVVVPRWDGRPIMSITEHRYYRRAADSTRPAEEYEIQEMYGRQSSPKLKLEFGNVKLIENGHERIVFNFDMRIVNEGRGVANDFMVEHEKDFSYSRVTGRIRGGKPPVFLRIDGDKFRFYSEPGTLLYQDDDLYLETFRMQLPGNYDETIKWRAGREIRYRIESAGMARVKGVWKFPYDQIKEAYDNAHPPGS